MKQSNSIEDIRTYYLSRLSEIELHCANSNTIWIFVDIVIFMAALAKVVSSHKYPKINKDDMFEFIEFIYTYLPAGYHKIRLDARHKLYIYENGSFIEKTTATCFPAIMYKVLRCGLVHSLSVNHCKYGRYIALANNNEVSENLSVVQTRHNTKCVVFVAERMITDLKCAIERIYKQAATNKSFATRIIQQFAKIDPIKSNY